MESGIVQKIVESCRIYYNDALISKETIIEKYLRFFAKQFDAKQRTVSFTFHTGSICFDIASVAALLIGCLACDISNNDEILRSLETDDMVIFRGQRYRWGGIKLNREKTFPQIDYITLNQDAKGKDGRSMLKIPYDRNKHLIKPYYGASTVTDGRGVRKCKNNRVDFISHILNISENDVPTTISISVVVVSDKNRFIELCKHMQIEYGNGKRVALTDVVPVSYFTVSGEQFQIGKNQSKAEAVIKVTSKLSVARDLVLDKQGNKVIGLLVVDSDSVGIESSELNDLLRRNVLRFAHVSSVYTAANADYAMEQYSEAKIFACTKEFLSGSSQDIVVSGKLTVELGKQMKNIINRKIHPVQVDGGWSWETYKTIKEKLYSIKQSHWTGDDRNNFVLSTMALINLFTTSFFTMETMETAVCTGKISMAVVSPEARLTELQNISIRTTFNRQLCSEIVELLLDVYGNLYADSPKGNKLFELLDLNSDKKIALIVPKAYYSDIFRNYFQRGTLYANTECVTANRFDNKANYDLIVSVGNIIGKRFDPIECFTASDIYILLYSSEGKLFNYKRRKYAQSERKLNARIKGLKGEDYIRAVGDDEENEDIQETTVREFADLDKFVDSMGMFDISKFASSGAGTDGYSSLTEVKYVGIFTTGEQILFSKYYSAVVFEPSDSKVTETTPEKLNPGDILVFTKKNDYTRNIVDLIFEQLLKTRRLDAQVQDAAMKASYWKEALREYKEKNGMTYRDLAKEMKKFGSSLQEVTMRQWLVEESHIVGPRDETTMERIGKITQDPYLLEDAHGYFEACREVRRYRRKILSLIAEAINNKLSNIEPAPGSAFEIAYKNVENLSEILELENVFELDETATVSNNIINRPIMEAEVLM